MSASNEVHHSLPPKGTRVAVAMSGGVDSSVTAGWLKQMGYQVIGISLQLHDMAGSADNKFGTCCSLSDIADARRVAEKLDIPFYVANMEETFHAEVIDDFIHEYLVGRTPNPCVKCNEKVKFKKLLDWALDLGAEYLATGHYATIRYSPETGQYDLCKGLDSNKDQSYFLFTMNQEELKHTLFPVGTFEKSAVRELARKLDLAVAEKPDSQEICFVQSRSYTDFIDSNVPASLLKSGPIIDKDGVVLGQHPGLHHYTIGQRKGIGVPSPVPLFVLAIDKSKNAIVVGPEELLFRKKATVSHLNWITAPSLDHPQKWMAKIRYRSRETPVEVTPLTDNRVSVSFLEPQRAITPGQAMVFYQEDRVLGGGWIEDLPLS